MKISDCKVKAVGPMVNFKKYTQRRMKEEGKKECSGKEAIKTGKWSKNHLSWFPSCPYREPIKFWKPAALYALTIVHLSDSKNLI